MPPTLPPISTLPSLAPTTHALILNTLFEPSPRLHTLSVPLLSTPHPSYENLIEDIRAQLTQLSISADKEDRETLDAILGAHPRLGAPREEIESEQSLAEQRRLNTSANNDGDEEAKELAKLNREYEATFPGLRYVVFVNGRERGEIMEDMRARIGRGDAGLERGEGIRAMCDIALDRARKLQSE